MDNKYMSTTKILLLSFFKALLILVLVIPFFISGSSIYLIMITVIVGFFVTHKLIPLKIDPEKKGLWNSYVLWKVTDLFLALMILLTIILMQSYQDISFYYPTVSEHDANVNIYNTNGYNLYNYESGQQLYVEKILPRSKEGRVIFAFDNSLKYYEKYMSIGIPEISGPVNYIINGKLVTEEEFHASQEALGIKPSNVYLNITNLRIVTKSEDDDSSSECLLTSKSEYYLYPENDLWIEGRCPPVDWGTKYETILTYDYFLTTEGYNATDHAIIRVVGKLPPPTPFRLIKYYFAEDYEKTQ